MAQSLLNKAIYARSMNGVITLSDGTLEISNGAITNASSIQTDYLQTQILDISNNVIIEGNLNLKGNLTCGDASTDNHTLNGKLTFNNVLPECGLTPTTAGQLTNKNYVDTNFVYKTGAISETISGVKTFTGRVLCTNVNIGQNNNDLINITYADGRYGQLAGTNAWTGDNTFTRNTNPITVQNALWTDGSGARPTSTAKTTVMFDNVKNATITIQGWTFVGTAITTINGMRAEWNFQNPNGYNNYNSPLAPNSGDYWMNFYCFSPGTTQSNSTFYLEAPPTLQPGMYTIQWYSKFTAGTQFATTSLSVSLGSGASLLTYNDSDTRFTNIWRLRTLTFEVKTASRLRWTYRDTQSTANQLFSASVVNLQITQYPALKINDASNNSFIAGSLSQLNNTLMNGTNIINGTLSMTGIPNFVSSKGSNNLVMNSSFTQATNATLSSSNIVFGSMAFYAEQFSNCILMGYNGMSNGSNQQKVATDCIVLGSNTFGGYLGDVMIGVGATKGYTATSNGGGETVLIGYNAGEGGGLFRNMTRVVGIGTNVFRGYPFAGWTEMVENVGIGSNVLTGSVSGWSGSFCTAVGTDVMRLCKGNSTNSVYNTAIGYRSGFDPRALPMISPNQTYTQAIYSYQTFVGAYARTSGDISGCQYGTALGYNAQTDASYCTVIGADASYNVANTIRLGRPQDKTVCSSLWDIGNFDCSGTITVNNGITATNTQTINFGTNAPTMSGANISTASIPDGALTGNVALKNATNTFTQINTFSQPIVPYKFSDSIVAIGANVLNSASSVSTAGTDSVIIGKDAGLSLNYTSNGYNTLIGFQAGYALLRGQFLTMIGYSSGAGLAGSTASLNSVGIGSNCLGLLTRIKHSLNIGTNAFLGIETYLTDWDYNVVMGSDAFGSNDCAQSQESVFIGYSTGGNNSNTSIITKNVVIGFDGSVSGNYSKSVAISGDTPVITASNTFFIGDATNTTKMVLNGREYTNQSTNTLINGGTTLSFPVYTSYSVSATTAFTITLPTIEEKHLGTEILFRRVGGTTTTIVSFIGNGTQKIYNTALTGGGTAQTLMANGVYIVRLIALVDGVVGTYAWFQV